MTQLWRFNKHWSVAGIGVSLSKGADINGKGGTLVEPILMAAVWAERSDVVAFLLDQPGILVNATNINGDTALHYALYHANEGILRMLLDSPGVNPDVWKRGESLLMTAMSMAAKSPHREDRRHLKCFRAIALVPGVDLDTRNVDGCSLEDIANEVPIWSGVGAELLRIVEEARRKRKEKGGVGFVRGGRGGRWEGWEWERRTEMEAILQKHEMEVRLSKEVEEEILKEAKEKREKVEQEYEHKLSALMKEKETKVDELAQELKEKQEFIGKERQGRFETFTKKMMACRGREMEVAFKPEAPNCPVCFEAMAPPVRIFQCAGGHLVCGNCRPRITVS